jgi:hypothetical protein
LFDRSPHQVILVSLLCQVYILGAMRSTPAPLEVFPLPSSTHPAATFQKGERVFWVNEVRSTNKKSLRLVHHA